MCFDFLYTFCLKYFKKNWARYDPNCIFSASEVAVIIVTFHLDLNFLNSFSKIDQKSNSWKSIQWELSCSMRKGRYDEANSSFLQFYEETKMTLMSHKE